jgi:hypothetical protein
VVAPAALHNAKSAAGQGALIAKPAGDVGVY